MHDLDMKHDNTGYCERCHKLIDHFPGLYQPLLEWFVFFQKHHPEAHISCAGRGEADQNHAYESGVSRAQWTESAHNWNAALDFFVLKKGLDIYDKNWFELVLGANIPQYLQWYGEPNSSFYELPHVQVRNWHGFKDIGELKLVSRILISQRPNVRRTHLSAPEGHLCALQTMLFQVP